MGRPKDFPNIYEDLLTKYKSKSTADKEYKEYLAIAREQGLSKEARLDDITTGVPTAKKEVNTQPREKKQRVSGAFVTPLEKELYERLVEAERQRAEAEKARGDDLREIALRLASGKKDDVVIPPSPAADEAPEKPAAGAGAADNIETTPQRNKSKTQTGGGSASQSKPKGTPFP